MKKPETERAWTTLYYGSRGACKSLHQGKQTLEVLNYFVKLYRKYPRLHQAIIFTNQILDEKIYEKYKEYIYYWEDQKELEFCPRKNCWRGPEKHELHGATVNIDDIATLLPPDGWRETSISFRKMLSQARHNGVRILCNGHDPFGIDINFRRYIDVAYKFTKLAGSRDPDETRPPVKWIGGIYRRRRINSELLWKYGDLPEQQIRLQAIQNDQTAERLREIGRQIDIVYNDSWRGSYHLFWKKHTEVYNTHQNVKARHELPDRKSAAKSGEQRTPG